MSENDERFSKAFRASPDALVISRASDGTIHDVNQSFLELFGLEQQDTVGRRSTDLGLFADPADREKLLGILKERGNVRDFEFAVRARGGEIKTVLLSTESVDTSDGPCLLTIIRDVTERKRAEVAVRRTAEQQRILSEALAHLLSAEDPRKLVRNLFHNVAAHLDVDAYLSFLVDQQGETLELESYGGVPEGLVSEVKQLELGQGISGTVAQTRRPMVVADVQSSTHPKAAMLRRFGFESYACNPLISGERLLGTLAFGSRTRTRFDEADLEFLGIISNYAAIAIDRTRAEQALRQSEAGFRQLAQSMPQLVWTANPDGTVDYYNHRVHQYGGAHLSEAGHWEWAPMLHPEDAASTLEAWSRAVKKGTDYQVEHRVRMADGSYRWHLSRAYPSRDAKGQVLKWFGTATDIDDHKRAQEILEQHVQERTAKLRETVADLTQFSYSLAHDLRAPLRSMNSFSTLLLEEHQHKLDGEALDYLQRIASAAKRMDDLIRDVLTYTKVARSELTLERVDLDQLTREIVQQYPHFHPEHADLQLISPLAPVLGSVALVTQCVSNLLSNAVKFVAPGVKARVKIWTEQQDSRVRFLVQDNGIGIDPEHLERIWRIFERAHHQKEYAGTGIGLSIVKRAAERMSGAVGVRSEPGQGSTFWLELNRP